MLDLTKIARQMRGISEHLSREAEAARSRVELAQRLMQDAVHRQAELVQQLVDAGDRLAFAVAEPVEPLATAVALEAAPVAHTVIATDGSQISPSHHEIAYCYLINVGRVILHYGQSRFPLLDSLPEVVYRSEDLYLSRQWGIGTEEWMGYRRTVAEVVVLAELGEALRQVPFAPPLSDSPSPTQLTLGDVAAPGMTTAPLLALVDGSLIYWFLETLPTAARDQILPPILAAWDRLRQRNIPLVGYLSASRSGESLNFLRLVACPFNQPDCQRHCHGQADQAPCGVFAPLRDATYWATVLEPGQRSPFWQSSAAILDSYGDHRVYFCYVHVGAEVARVEMPAWVMAQPALRDEALDMVLTQVQKGYGYPVALAEAHNQAVVRGGDRSRFFALLEQEMIRAGLKQVGISYKEARKRGSIA
jgi:hypothetical protein